jgi:hypothetical protein
MWVCKSGNITKWDRELRWQKGRMSGDIFGNIMTGMMMRLLPVGEKTRLLKISVRM